MHGLVVQFILFPQFGDDAGQKVTEANVTKGLLGGCCQVTFTPSALAKTTTFDGHEGIVSKELYIVHNNERVCTSAYVLSASVCVVAIQITLNKVINTGNRYFIRIYMHISLMKGQKQECPHISTTAKVSLLGLFDQEPGRAFFWHDILY